MIICKRRRPAVQTTIVHIAHYHYQLFCAEQLYSILLTHNSSTILLSSFKLEVSVSRCKPYTYFAMFRCQHC